MKQVLLLLWVAPFLLQAQLKYPETKKENVADDYNGIMVEDRMKEKKAF